MGREFVGLALPGQTAEALQAPHGELVEVALDAATGDIGQACDLLVRKALALEPQDLHLLLDTGMGMVVTLVAEGVEVFGSEGETAHEEPQCSGMSAAHYEFRPRLAIVPDSYVSSITLPFPDEPLHRVPIPAAWSAARLPLPRPPFALTGRSRGQGI